MEDAEGSCKDGVDCSGSLSSGSHDEERSQRLWMLGGCQNVRPLDSDPQQLDTLWKQSRKWTVMRQNWSVGGFGETWPDQTGG